MLVDEKTLGKARKLKHAHVVQVLAAYYPQVYRMALALCGREDAGRGTVRFVMGRAVRMMPKWSPDLDPWRWFAHYTVMVARRAQAHQPEARSDVLVEKSPVTDPAYIAFIRALRKLHPQQREAIVLTDGEGFNARELAVAMDCSVEAAANHRIAGLESLRPIVPNLEQMLAQLKTAYAQLTPYTELELPSIKALVGRRLMPRRMLRWTLFTLVVIAAIWIWQRYQ